MLDMLEKESAQEKPDELKPSELDEFKALLQEEKSQDWEDIKEKKSKKKQKKDKQVKDEKKDKKEEKKDKKFKELTEDELKTLSPPEQLQYHAELEEKKEIIRKQNKESQEIL